LHIHLEQHGPSIPPVRAVVEARGAAPRSSKFLRAAASAARGDLTARTGTRWRMSREGSKRKKGTGKAAAPTQTRDLRAHTKNPVKLLGEKPA
jgi:hypothetical protein